MSINQTSLYASDNEEKIGININQFVQIEAKKKSQQSPNTDTSPFSSIKVTPVGLSPNEANAEGLTNQSTRRLRP